MFRVIKNKPGFSFVQLLFVFVVLSTLGFIGWHYFQKPLITQAPKPKLIQVNPTGILFATIDGLSIKVSRFDIQKKQTTQFFQKTITEPASRSLLSASVGMQVSSDEQLIAYRFNGEENIKIITNVGVPFREIAHSNGRGFSWMNATHQLILNVPRESGCSSAICEAPIFGQGSNWYMYDVDTNKETKLNTGNNSFDVLEGQASNLLYFSNESAYGLAPKLFAFILDTQKVSEVQLPNERGFQIGFISHSPSGVRTIISILPPNYGATYRCTIYELRENKILSKILDEANYECKNAEWINDDQFYFDNSTGVHGEINTSNSTPLGFYILSAISKYTFSNHSTQNILTGTTLETYELLGTLPNNLFIVLTRAATGSPQQKLEIRNSDGKLELPITTSPREILFLGTTL